MGELDTVTLGDVAEVTVGFVGSMTAEYVDSGVPFLRSLNVRPYRISTDELKFVSPEFDKKIAKSSLRPGDVVMVRTGKPGQAAVIPESLDHANCSDLVVVRPSARLNANWLAYFLNGMAMNSISAGLVGAVQQHFNVKSAKSMILRLPGRGVQDAIAEVLSALDDKITANERLVQIADDLAQATIRSAFRGDSVELKDIAVVTMGSSPPGTTYNEKGSGMPFYQGVRDFGVRFPRRRVWTTAPVRTASASDTLISVRAPVGRSNLAVEELCLGRGLAGLSSRVGNSMTLFHQVRASRDVWAPFEAEGTVFGSIDKVSLESIEVPKVPRDAEEQLEGALASIEGRIAAALAESVALARTRDELLPLLMSGKVTVRDAERAVSDVV